MKSDSGTATGDSGAAKGNFGMEKGDAGIAKGNFGAVKGNSGTEMEEEAEDTTKGERKAQGKDGNKELQATKTNGILGA